MNEAVVLDVEARPERIEKKVKQGYCDRMTADVGEAARDGWKRPRKKGKGFPSAWRATRAKSIPELVRKGFIPDILTDQTSRAQPLDYVPAGSRAELDGLRASNPDEYKKRSLETIRAPRPGHAGHAETGRHGFRLRKQPEGPGRDGRPGSPKPDGTFGYPVSFRPTSAPCSARDAGRSGGPRCPAMPRTSRRLDRLVLDMFPDNDPLASWIRLAGEKIPHLGLPARVCWLGYGERAEFGLE